MTPRTCGCVDKKNKKSKKYVLAGSSNDDKTSDLSDYTSCDFTENSCG